MKSKVLKLKEFVLKLNEFNQEKDIDIPMKSFKTQKELNPAVWIDENTIDPEIRKDLLEIANDLYNDLELDFQPSDIILTGSNSNYNWSEYSDFDLHILLDFKKVDSNIELVKKYFDSVKGMWNVRHNIKIHEYDVEIYLQDINEPHVSSGIFSLMNNKWIVEPHPFDHQIDKDVVNKKSKDIMSQVDYIEDNLHDMTYNESEALLKKVWEKIKKYRAEGLVSHDAELSTGNIIFKLLRRNGYIGKIVDLKLQAYDKQHSIK